MAGEAYICIFEGLELCIWTRWVQTLFPLVPGCLSRILSHWKTWNCQKPTWACCHSNICMKSIGIFCLIHFNLHFSTLVIHLSILEVLLVCLLKEEIVQRKRILYFSRYRTVWEMTSDRFSNQMYDRGDCHDVMVIWTCGYNTIFSEEEWIVSDSKLIEVLAFKESEHRNKRICLCKAVLHLI